MHDNPYDEYDEIYGDDDVKLFNDTSSDWIRNGYLEDGDGVQCDWCGGAVRYDDERCIWYCESCYKEFNRAEWFNMIGADPPGHKCLSQCRENYPICKRWCSLYDIPDDDPIL